jgi:CRP/FNR family cyclic AMP-dependent transcriptional regulator
MKTSKRAGEKRKPGTFDAETFLTSAGVARTIMEFGRNDTLFSQGDPCKNIMYIQKGEVKISVVSTTGKEAVVGMLQPGDFIGEGGLAGQQMRMATATAVTPVSVLVIENSEMFRLLHAESAFSDRFITYML